MIAQFAGKINENLGGVMPIIIDGHNLIPKIKGIELNDLDDEMELIEILQRFARVQRKNIEVYFDNAPVGIARSHCYGLVNAFFVHNNLNADKAIIDRLKNIHDSPRNWTVVSSDRWVQRNARQLGARIISSSKFAKQIQQKNKESVYDETEPDKMSEDQINEWLDIFSSKENHG